MSIKNIVRTQPRFDTPMVTRIKILQKKKKMVKKARNTKHCFRYKSIRLSDFQLYRAPHAVYVYNTS